MLYVAIHLLYMLRVYGFGSCFFFCDYTVGAKRYIPGLGGRCEVDDLDGIMDE